MTIVATRAARRNIDKNNPDDPYDDERYYTFNTDTLPYLYDSIRYQVDKRLTVTQQIAFDGFSWSEPVDLDETEQYIALSANLDNAWNWSFAIDEDDATQRPYLYENVQATIIQKTDGRITTRFSQDYQDLFSLYYTRADVTENYRETYVGPDVDINYSQYSDFVKALEYVIYCYSLDLTPGQVVVEPVMTTTQEGTTKYYSVKVVETSNGQQIELSGF